MRRTHLLLLFMLVTLITGIVMSQGADPQSAGESTAEPALSDEIAFRLEGEIALALPRKIVYDPQREHMAVVDAYNRLLFIDATTYETIQVLHERGQYADLQFSHDGRWLAVAYNLTVELWDTETVTLAARIDQLGNIYELRGPMAFSSDNRMLIFYGDYPTPRALRISENDRTTYPWVWDTVAARGEAASTLPRDAEALQMTDYPNGFVLAPGDKIVAALPSRLRILDAFTLDVLHEIPTDRYEQDPLRIWSSLQDGTVYVHSDCNALLKINVETGESTTIPTCIRNEADETRPIYEQVQTPISQQIGDTLTSNRYSLLDVLLDDDYRADYRYGSKRMTVSLVDLLLPPASSPDNVRALLYVEVEERVQNEDDTFSDVVFGTFLFDNPYNYTQLLPAPDRESLLARQFINNDEFVVSYKISTGTEINRFLPALRAIGSYRRLAKNRVLAFNQNADVIISDFERLNARNYQVLASDLRYSRYFDRFFFSGDSQKIITQAGTEWREWDIATGEVLRREQLRSANSIVATSPDGYRFLSYSYHTNNTASATVVDYNTNESYTVNFQAVPGAGISDIYPNPSWTRFLVVYGVNEYGAYAPGNQVALYDYQDGKKWLVAGDDLPPASERRYGWVDDNTPYVFGRGRIDDQPGRVYGVEYAANSLPQCVEDAYPDHLALFAPLWERMVYRLNTPTLDTWTQILCGQLPDTPEAVAALMQPTPTLAVTPFNPGAEGEVPACLLARYPEETEAYTALWQQITATTPPEQVAQLAGILCEGIGDIYLDGGIAPVVTMTMFFDIETGARISGAFEPAEIIRKPLDPIVKLFERTERRSPGTIILSPDEQLIASSSLPGELVVYRMLTPYQQLADQVTATAMAQLATANLIRAEATTTPTFAMIGTLRPTLTPTAELTMIPRPEEMVYDQIGENLLCPMPDTYFTPDNLPAGYDATGQIHAQVFGESLWVVEPETGQRAPNEDIPQCGVGINCQFSPDKSWILANTYELIYVSRPDGSDQRLLWDLRTPNPPTPAPYDIYWSGSNVLEWQDSVPVVRNGRTVYENAYLRDVLNVFPDPAPFFTDININELPTTLVSRQPGGDWAVAYTQYNTGVGPGYKYYLYNTVTGEASLFAQNKQNQVDVFWHPLGDRLFFTFDFGGVAKSSYYQISFPSQRGQQLGTYYGSEWSNDGRYRATTTTSFRYPVGVWDTVTGMIDYYCLPQLNNYSGPFVWSPDGEYLALLTMLPSDANVEGVGNHLLVIKRDTGEVVDLTTGVVNIITWAQEPGTYGSGAIASPTPAPITPTPTLTPSPTPS